MSRLKSRIIKIERIIGTHRKLNDADYQNCRKYVWAGTVPDHPELAHFVKEMRRYGMMWLTADFLDREKRRIVQDNGIVWENLTDEEIAVIMSPKY